MPGLLPLHPVSPAVTEPPGLTHVEIDGNAASATVRVGGHMLACTRATLTLNAQEVPVLTVALPAFEGVVTTLSDVLPEFAAETRAVLIAMGWTPPLEPGVP